MAFAGGYVSRVPTIINYTIVATATWEKAASKVVGSRKFFIKTKDSTDNAFDLAFVAAPSTFLTSDVYVRTDTAGTVFEIAYWS